LERSAEPPAQHADNQAVAAQELRREVRGFLLAQEQRRKVFPRAVLVGLLAGLLAVAFWWALDGGERLRTHLILWGHHYPMWCARHWQRTHAGAGRSHGPDRGRRRRGRRRMA
jgi:hypothetical protein